MEKYYNEIRIMDFTAQKDEYLNKNYIMKLMEIFFGSNSKLNRDTQDLWSIITDPQMKFFNKNCDGVYDEINFDEVCKNKAIKEATRKGLPPDDIISFFKEKKDEMFKTWFKKKIGKFADYLIHDKHWSP